MDGSGSQLRRVYRAYGVETTQAWLSFDDVYAAAGQATGQMAGAAWYRWPFAGATATDCGLPTVRRLQAGGGRSSREDFNRVGPFSVVLLVP
jgi:hypothetical protein